MTKRDIGKETLDRVHKKGLATIPYRGNVPDKWVMRDDVEDLLSALRLVIGDRNFIQEQIAEWRPWMEKALRHIQWLEQEHPCCTGKEPCLEFSMKTAIQEMDTFMAHEEASQVAETLPDVAQDIACRCYRPGWLGHSHDDPKCKFKNGTTDE